MSQTNSIKQLYLRRTLVLQHIDRQFSGKNILNNYINKCKGYQMLCNKNRKGQQNKGYAKNPGVLNKQKRPVVNYG
ncbi:hypothetical protein, partial [Limnovirga soli]|uniref:hypothetical protein n=1 Tax=Limnovirga soli TaxID=2656915 RepID=UPI001C0EE242